MVFASETFLFLFLPLFLVTYYATPNRHRTLTILLGSYVFYGWWRIDFLGLLILTTLWTYGIGRIIHRHLGTVTAQRACAVGVIGCLLVLATFKYLNFFTDSLAALFGTEAENLGFHWRLILPIGISFYIFQSISYLVDITRRDAPAAQNIIHFAAFIALFPQLIAGPILRYKDIAPQLQHRQHSGDIFNQGVARFTIGLGKKILLADTLAPLVDLAFQTPDPSAPLAWLGALAYMLQLYFDFSGYSDMAIGLGLMMGFRFTANFNAPYHATSITEFWRRWHISLSVWLRDYLYLPLGGNRHGPARTYANLILVMLLGGLWHGANLTFLVWGAWHGGWLACERLGLFRHQSRGFGQLRCLLIVLAGWVIFRADNIAHALDYFQAMAGHNGWHMALASEFMISRESLIFLAIAMVAVMLERHRPIAALSRPGAGPVLSSNQTLAGAATLSLLAVFSLMKLAEQSFSPFLYFQF